MLHGRVECPKCGDIKRNCICADHLAFVTYVECGNCTRMASASAEASSLKKQILEVMEDVDQEMVFTHNATFLERYLLRKLQKIKEILDATCK